MTRYVHGYSKTETKRLYTQASAISSLISLDTIYPAGARVLDAGCGVGAQTVQIAGNNPGARFVSIDIAEESLRPARRAARKSQLKNIEFMKADILRLPFRENTFDHVFLCFVLEHLRNPAEALAELKRVLKPGGTLTCIEGDHGSCSFYPESSAARAAWNALVTLQKRLGGDPLIGRRLYPLLSTAGFSSVNLSPRLMYVDARKSRLMKDFVQGTIVAMTQGIRRKAVASGIISRRTFDSGIRHLENISKSGSATFCYTFFKAVAVKQRFRT